MDSSQDHCIIVDNFSNDQTVTYGLIILKGHVNRTKECPIDKAKEIVLYLDDIEINTKLMENKFKFILELKQNLNEIKLTWCCVSLTLAINYTPKITDYSIQPLYIICAKHDGKFQAPKKENNSTQSALRRITLISKMLQSVTAEKLYEKMLNRRTFHLAGDCEVFNSNLHYLEARKMEQTQLWEYFGREIMESSVADEKKKYLGFLSCTRYCDKNYHKDIKSYNDIVSITEGYVALGGGGLALFGTACLYTWPERYEDICRKFQNYEPVDKKRFMDDSCYRGTWGGCFSTTFGSTLHELSHCFNLGHTDKGIMSRGFDNIYKVFVSDESMAEKSSKVSSKFYKTIEFNEPFGPIKHSDGLETQKKTFQITGDAKIERDADDTFWTKSCAALLFYHRWFNDSPNTNNAELKYDTATRLLKSPAGIKVIEIRRECDEQVLSSWVFEARILTYSFHIPEENVTEKNLILIAEDAVGNLLKEFIS